MDVAGLVVLDAEALRAGPAGDQPPEPFEQVGRNLDTVDDDPLVGADQTDDVHLRRQPLGLDVVAQDRQLRMPVGKLLEALERTIGLEGVAALMEPVDDLLELGQARDLTQPSAQADAVEPAGVGELESAPKSSEPVTAEERRSLLGPLRSSSGMESSR